MAAYDIRIHSHSGVGAQHITAPARVCFEGDRFIIEYRDGQDAVRLCLTEHCLQMQRGEALTMQFVRGKRTSARLHMQEGFGEIPVSTHLLAHDLFPVDRDLPLPDRANIRLVYDLWNGQADRFRLHIILIKKGDDV